MESFPVCLLGQKSPLAVGKARIQSQRRNFTDPAFGIDDIIQSGRLWGQSCCLPLLTITQVSELVRNQINLKGK